MDNCTTLKDISLTIYGLKKTIRGLSEYTVCDDVIDTVFDKLAISKIYASSFAIFESVHGRERQLSGKVRVLKLVRSWGLDHDKCELIMKRVDNVPINIDTNPMESGLSVTQKVSNVHGISEQENCAKDVIVDRELSDVKKPKLKRATGLSSIQRGSKSNKSTPSKISKFEKLNLNKLTTPETGGKMYILKKFMNDVKLYGEVKQKESKIQLTPRTPGDGSDEEIALVRNCRETRRYSELGENVRTPGDGEYSTITFNERLNDAFMYSDPHEICRTPKTTMYGLDEAFLVTGEDQFYDDNIEADNFSADVHVNTCGSKPHVFTYSSSENYLERQKRDALKYVKDSEIKETRHETEPDNFERIKNILATASNGTPSTSSSEDSLVESFMNTKLHEENTARQCL